MTRLISNRLYFDYNATAPLAHSVEEWLAKGAFFYGNPSSLHSTGKQSKRVIKEISEYIRELFSLDSLFYIVFHSGATEGINTLIKGYAHKAYLKGQRIHFFYSPTDHSCVYNLREDLEAYGHKTHTIKIDSTGDFSDQDLITEINKINAPVLLNYTYVNNETGVIWDLNRAAKIKDSTGCHIHVDAVQSVGKIEDWSKINQNLDSYTWSAHKFGALKGCGFSIVKDDFDCAPLLRGGGQQNGLRSGTENVTGIQSISLALEEINKNFNFQKLNSAKELIESSLLKIIGNRGQIVASSNLHRNGNTIYFIIEGVKASVLSAAFDIAGIDVGTGAACSSGDFIPSRVLLNMGYSKEQAKSAIRLSFSPMLKREEAVKYLEKITPIVERFI